MKKFLILSIITITLLSVFAFVWHIRQESAKAARVEADTLKSLTADELALVVKSEASADLQSIKALAEDAERRKLFIKGMREHLALAAQARRENFTDNADYKINVEYKKNILLADLYRLKLSEPKKLYTVPETEIVAVWQSPENEKLFKRDLDVLKKIRLESAEASGNKAPDLNFDGQALTEIKNRWATTKILSDRAKTDAEFMNQPEIVLRLKIVEAGILSSDFLRAHWTDKIRATDDEIKSYLAAHPEYDVAKKRAKAEEVLRKAKAGEDFSKLAKEFSEDRASRENGGLYEDVAENIVWKEVEQTALDLKNGEIADRIVESNLGFHIVKLEDKKLTKNADGNEKVLFTFRHIVLQKNFEEPGPENSLIPKPFMTALEIAKQEVEREKRARFIQGIIERNPVSMPDDFTVALPETEDATN